MERYITIKEVARKAGVGIATVSRVLNKSQRVDPATRAKVEAVIRRLGYRPNAQGRRLVKQTSEMVCFILSNRGFVNPFHSGILFGAERFLAQAGHDVVFSNLYYSGDTAPDNLTLPRIVTHRGIADGLILAGTLYPNLLEAIDRMRVPYVLFANNIIGEEYSEAAMRPMDAVYYEDGSSARQLVELLVRQGHQAIWFVGDIRMPWFKRRQSSYRTVMKEHGLQPREYTAGNAGDYQDYGIHYGEQAAEHVLRSGEPVTAIFGANDGIAYGVWRILHRRGLGVPGDVSLVGFDDVQEARLTDPPLTTVHVATQEIGRACAEMLLEKLQGRGKAVPSRAVATSLVERGSCAPPRADAERSRTAAR